MANKNLLNPKKGGGHEIKACQNLELYIKRGYRLDFGGRYLPAPDSNNLQMLMHAPEHVFCRKYWFLVSGKLKVYKNHEYSKHNSM
jgi:hypothetical protein